MLKAEKQRKAVRAAKEKLGEATGEELSAYIREAFGLTIQPFIVAVLIGTGKEREHLDQVNRQVRGKLEGWKAENPEEAKKLAATAKRKEAARRKKASRAEVSPPVMPDSIPVAETPDVAAKVSASLPTL
jgi:hypothetical protein